MNNYTIPAGYAYIGTVAEIAQDILNLSVDTNEVAASTEFVVGTCANLGTVSFQLGNKEPVTARFAILAMKAIGVEVDWDNFTINLPVTVGSGNSPVFQFGINLANVRTHWQKGNGATRTFDIANLQRIPGHEDDVFDVGDSGTVIDSFADETFTDRIITYTKCLDDPTKDSITMGVFIQDASTDSVTMQINIDTRIQQGKAYNNCSISHEEGFKTSTSDGSIQVIQNATNGFLVQHLINGSWVTVWTVESYSGKMVAYNAEHTQKVEFGGEYGLTTWRGNDALQEWEQTGGLDTDGNFVAARLSTPGSSTYGVIGSTPEGYIGLQLINALGVKMCEILELVGGGFIQRTGERTVLYADANSTALEWQNSSGSSTSSIKCNADGVSMLKDGYGTGSYDNIYLGNSILHFVNGMLSNFEDNGTLNATVPLASGSTLIFTKGLLTDIQ